MLVARRGAERRTGAALWCSLCLFFVSNASALPDLRELARPYASHPISVSVRDAASGEVIAELNSHAPLMPASVQKLVLSAAALKHLGGDYRFETRFYGTIDRTGTAPLLEIKGGSDPSLKLETLASIAQELKRRGLRKILSLRFDAAATPDAKPQTGPEAYEGPSGALSASFNAIELEVCPSKRGPVLARINPPELKISDILGSAALRDFKGIRACTSEYRSIADPLHFFEKVFRVMLEREGIKVAGAASRGPVSARAPLLYTQVSEPLRSIVEGLNHFSTNFTAEELLAALGTEADGSMRRSTGIQRMTEYLLQRGAPRGEFNFVDGSGLSRNNRLSTSVLTRLLRDVREDPGISEDFFNSLSVAGVSGTLKGWNLDTPGLVFRGKTGSLDDVRALAGLLESRGGRIFLLAVIQNDVENGESAVEFEKALIRAFSIQ